MKRIIVLVLASLFLTFNPALADGKANVKIGQAQLIADSDKGHNVTVSKSGTGLNVAITANKLVISSNPSTATIGSSIVFAVPEEDFVSGETYDLAPTTNLIVVASYTHGSVGGGVSNTTGSEVTGTLKVTSYNSSTGKLKATLNAKMSPSTITTIKNGSSSSKDSSKPVPIVMKLDVTLD